MNAPRTVAGATADQLILGLDTFGDVTRDAEGERVSHGQVIRDVVEQAALADRLGVDAITLGEHHRDDFALSSPEIALAAIAGRTERILLGTGVTVLSSDDPVRVYERFATLDAVSSGRAEVILGRGSFTESFPLFGYDLDDYDALFDEKLRLLLALNDGERLSWPGGRFTPAVEGCGVYPRPTQPRLPVWIAVGGTPQSVVRAGTLGLPLALAIIGGEPARFAPLFDLYRRAAAQAGHDPAGLPTSINVHGFVAGTSREAADIFYPAQAAVMDRIGGERGWPPTSRAQFEAARGPNGAIFAGSPAEVTDKILAAHEIFGFDRFLIQMAIGVIDHAALLRAIELFATKVAPEVRKATAPARA